MAYSAGALNSIADTLASIVSKKVGNLYRFGGSTGTQEFNKSGVGHGTGILYISSAGKALRFNIEDSLKTSDYSEIAITSIDFWKSYQFDATRWTDNTPSVNLKVPAGINAVQLSRMIIDVFLNMSLGAEKKVDSEITEARRVAGDEFAKIVQKEFGSTNVTFDQMKMAAAKHGVNVPMVARDTKGQRGIYNLGSLLTAGKKEQLVVPSSVKKAEQVAAKANISVEELFGDLEDLTDLVVSGKRPSLVVTGDPGTGKTFTVQARIAKAGKTRNKDWVLTKGKVSPFGIYSTLFMNRDRLIVFDDSDDVFFTPEARNILKAALDSYGERTVSWISKATINISGKPKGEQEAIIQQIQQELDAGGVTENVKLPSEFEFRGQIIFISNLSPDKIEPAILSRSLTINIQLSPADIFKKMEKLLPEIEPQVDLKTKKGVLAYLIDDHSANGSDKLPSMRTLIAGIQIASSGLKNWQRLLKYS